MSIDIESARSLRDTCKSVTEELWRIQKRLGMIAQEIDAYRQSAERILAMIENNHPELTNAVEYEND